MKQAFLIVKKTIRTIAPIINFLPFLGMCLILQAAMIYACVAFVCNCLGMMNDLIWPLTICILIVIDLSIWLRENKKVPKCEHGIRRGKEISRSTNKLRCPKCQQIAEQQAEERTKKLKLQESINARYNHLLEQAENRRRNAIQADKEKIKSLSPKAFEDLTAALFRRMGYKVKQTPYSNDGGKDAFAEKNGIQYLIECKHYKEDAKISRPLLQKLYAAMNENHIQHGIYVATCSYTQTAIEYGQQFHIELIDISRLLSLLRKYYNLKLMNDMKFVAKNVEKLLPLSCSMIPKAKCVLEVMLLQMCFVINCIRTQVLLALNAEDTETFDIINA